MSATKLRTARDLFDLAKASEYELIEGELLEVSPSFANSSQIAANFAAFILPFVRMHKLGFVTGEAGGYVLSRNPDTVLAPDFGFIKRSRLPSGLPSDEFVPCPPDLAVEVMSSSDRFRDLDIKAHRYLAAGTSLVWVVNPTTRVVTVYRPETSPIHIDLNGHLDGLDVLPGLVMPVTDVFRNPLD